MQPGATIEVFFDGECPLCVREIRFLQGRDRHGRIQFTDIAAPDFDAGAHGMTMADFMAQIRARLADGRSISGVEVFRQLYTAVGFGWLVKVTRAPGLSWLLDQAYCWFAKNRLRLTGRCEGDMCSIPSGSDTEAQPRAAS